MNGDKVNASADISGLVGQEQFAHEVMKERDNFVVRIYVDVAGERIPVHELSGNADNPYCSEQVVNV